MYVFSIAVDIDFNTSLQPISVMVAHHASELHLCTGTTPHRRIELSKPQAKISAIYH